MGFKNEPTSKFGHSDLVKNPEFHQFLKECEPVRLPDDAEHQTILDRFQPYPAPPPAPQHRPPAHIVALDGSPYVSQVKDNFPSIQVLYLRVASVLVDIGLIQQIRDEPRRTIDPTRMNKIREEENAVTFWFPGANITMKGHASPKSSFRRRLYENFLQEATKLDGRYLLDALYDGCRLRQESRTKDSSEEDVYDEEHNAVIIYKCPNEGCKSPDLRDAPVRIPRSEESVPCPSCHGPLYATDLLRLHEAFQDHQDNQGVLSRASLAVEHLMLLHYLQYIDRFAPNAISDLGFVMDGGLAIFGESAKFHRAIMAQVAKSTRHCLDHNLKPPVIFGLQKRGEVLDFARNLDLRRVADKQIPKGSFLIVDDNLRYTFVSPRPEKFRDSAYGEDTYYGQDIIVKTHAGRIFALNLSYPFASKSKNSGYEKRFEASSYPQLMRALATLELVQSGLYGDSSVPQMLAHRYASISHVPGGRILDVLARRALPD